MMATIRFAAHTPSGRAIEHLLDRCLSDHLGGANQGLELRWSGGDDRTLIVHPSMPRDDADGSLLMLIESLAGTGAVNLQQLYALATPDQREQVAIALFMAAGYAFGAPTGRRVAS